MSNSKTVPPQVVSNEEFIPLPLTRKQHAAESDLLDSGSRISKQLGIDRRQFSCTPGGMAAGFAARNTVFGRFFRMDSAELYDAAVTSAMKTEYFIFDVQTHHVGLVGIAAIGRSRLCAAWRCRNS
jgi:hypothetical protein